LSNKLLQVLHKVPSSDVPNTSKEIRNSTSNSPSHVTLIAAPSMGELTSASSIASNWGVGPFTSSASSSSATSVHSESMKRSPSPSQQQSSDKKTAAAQDQIQQDHPVDEQFTSSATAVAGTTVSSDCGSGSPLSSSSSIRIAPGLRNTPFKTPIKSERKHLRTPSRPKTLIRLFCGGGDCCDLPIPYKVENSVIEIPDVCSSGRHKVGRRGETPLKFRCVYCRTDHIEVADIIPILTSGNCSHCKEVLHGGVSNDYGIVMH
jgi:hypothetical protein